MRKKVLRKRLVSFVVLLGVTLSAKAATWDYLKAPEGLYKDWNSEQIARVALKALEAKAWKKDKTFCSTDPCIPDHKIIGEYAFATFSKKSVLVLTSSIAKDLGCHSCAPHISIFQFDKLNGNWRITKSHVDAFQWGSWGEVDPNNIRPIMLTRSRYALLNKGAYTGQGVTVENLSIQMPISDRFKEIAKIQTSEDNSGATADGNPSTSWHSKIKLHRGGGLYPMIEVKRAGIRNNAPYRVTEKLKYYGTQYRSVGKSK